MNQPTRQVEHRVRGSRFIARAVPATSREVVDVVLQEVRQAFPDATHICYAYRLATDRSEPEEFSTDSGEPGGSAGAPILNGLRQQEIVDAMIWVVRYYGGTKLGIPGLIEAYGDAARLSLENASKVPWIDMSELQLILPYTLVDRVKGEMRKLGGKILKEDYASDAAITCQIPRDKAPEFRARLKEWGSGAISVSDR
ncbi:IMPACT family protein [Candidatus Neomarinimicrobiota bacterium]